MKRTALALLLAVACGSAFAEWTRIGQSETGDTIYVDRSTIRTRENLVQIWYLYDLSHPPAGEKYVSVKAQSEFDCREGEYRAIAWNFYSKKMGGGDVVETGSDVSKWTPVVPGTLVQQVFKVACRK
jgi:hypothetical protein